MNIYPLADYVIIEPETNKETKAGLIIPDTGEEQPEIGTVYATGPGKPHKEILMKLETTGGGAGGSTNMTVKKGQRILFKKFAAHPIKLDGKKLLITEVDNIYAILE